MQDNENEVAQTKEEMTEATMLGDLMQCIVEQCKALPKPWQALSEAQQRDYLERVEKQVRESIKKAIFLLAAQESIVVPAIVNKVVFKDSVTVELKLTPGASGRHDIADAEGDVVHIMIIDQAALEGCEGKPIPEKDQRELPIENEPEPQQPAVQDLPALENKTYKSLAEMPRNIRERLEQEAVDVVVEYQVAATSLLQTKLHVSAEIAAELLAVLAANGIVSTPNHEGLRTVLVLGGDSQQEDDGHAD